MTRQLTLDDAEAYPDPTRHRHPDRPTSVEGARAVHYRAESHKRRLLAAYATPYGRSWGLTDEEAAAYALLGRACYWKRCGELRRDGMIVEIDAVREGEAGIPRIVCCLTARGVEELAR